MNEAQPSHVVFSTIIAEEPPPAPKAKRRGPGRPRNPYPTPRKKSQKKTKPRNTVLASIKYSPELIGRLPIKPEVRSVAIRAALRAFVADPVFHKHMKPGLWKYPLKARTSFRMPRALDNAAWQVSKGFGYRGLGQVVAAALLCALDGRPTP